MEKMLLLVAITIHSPKEIGNFYKRVLKFTLQKELQD